MGSQKGINFKNLHARDKEWYKKSHDTLDATPSRFDSVKVLSEMNSKYKRSFPGQVKIKLQVGREQTNVQLSMDSKQ